jgi:methyltransferase
MVNLFFLFLLFVVIIQRGIELAIAKRNAAFLRNQGAVEIGADHYKWIVSVHIFFFLSLIIEVVGWNKALPDYWWIPFMLFVIAQVLRVWCITSLGRYWNTRIIVLPGAQIVCKGPYRWMRHPNYAVVITEILVLPLIFGAYVTATIASAANLIVLLFIRIPAEEQALVKLTNYDHEMEHVPRFVSGKR